LRTVDAKPGSPGFRGGGTARAATGSLFFHWANPEAETLDQDFWAGHLLAAIRLSRRWLLCRAISFGTSACAGAGLFPTVLGATLALCRRFFLLRSLRARDRRPSLVAARADGLTVSLILLRRADRPRRFVPALVVLISDVCASTEFKFLASCC